MSPSATAARVPETNEARKIERGEAREKKDVEHLRIGPLVGVGFPRPLAIEGFVKIERVLGVGAEYSLLPRMNIAGVDTSFKAIAADLRIFPFRNAFFIGARAGRQWLDTKTTLTVGQLGSITESMSASTWFINPRAGFLVTFESGITVGIDVGVQLPINPSYERSGPATEAGVAGATGADQMLATAAKTLGNGVTPTIDVLRLGFLF